MNIGNRLKKSREALQVNLVTEEKALKKQAKKKTAKKKKRKAKKKK